MSKFLKILNFLWIGTWLFIGVINFMVIPTQIKEDQEFYEKEIKPSVKFIEAFKQKNLRLPNYREFYTWSRDYNKDFSSDLNQEVDSLIGSDCHSLKYIRRESDIIIRNDVEKFQGADWSKDYAISVWRGEWTEYYFSWKNENGPSINDWAISIIVLLAMSFIAFIPTVIWTIRRRVRKQKSSC
jgi:hypothetical protein